MSNFVIVEFYATSQILYRFIGGNSIPCLMQFAKGAYQRLAQKGPLVGTKQLAHPQQACGVLVFPFYLTKKLYLVFTYINSIIYEAENLSH
jgi:hypothetical protein